jgi:tetratricopeptide (TPR) repeat protein
MNIRQIRENLGRVRTNFQRNDMIRAVQCFVAGLQGLDGDAPPTDIRGDIREAVQCLVGDKQVKALLPAGQFGYTPGQAKELLALFTKILGQLKDAAEAEDHETALARKIKIDQAYNAGKKHLEQGRVSEADASFSEAVRSYRDEHRLFHMIAGLLVDAKEVVRAGPYLKKGLEALPGDPELLELLERARALRQAMKAQ